MRKDALLSLLKKYNESLSLYQRKDKRINWLEDFLATDAIKARESDADIYFSEFESYITTHKHADMTAFNNSIEKEKKQTIASLFTQFITADTRKNTKPLSFIFMPGVYDALPLILAYLNPKDLVNVSSTSALFKETKGAAMWRDNLIKAGCDAMALDAVIKTKKIHDYKKLYESFIKVWRIERNAMKEPWQLLCLTGEPLAISEAIKHHDLANKMMKYHTNPLHLTALSGNLKGLELVLTVVNDVKCTDLNMANALHYAALSGNPDMLKAVRALGISTNSADEYNRNIFHYAILSGNTGMLKTVLALKANPQSTSHHGENAVHYAALSGNPSMLKAVLALGIDKNSVTMEEDNALHYAALSGNPKMIEAVLALGIDKDSVSRDGSNVLHFAARSGNPDSIKAALSLGISAESTNNYKDDIFYFADRSGNQTINKDVIKGIIKSMATTIKANKMRN